MADIEITEREGDGRYEARAFFFGGRISSKVVLRVMWKILGRENSVIRGTTPMTQKTTLSFVLIIAIGGLVGSLAAIGVESLFFAITPNHPEKYVGFSFTHDGVVSNTAPPCAGNRQTLCIDSSQGLRFGNEEYFDHTECHLVEMRPKMRGADYDNIVVCE